MGFGMGVEVLFDAEKAIGPIHMLHLVFVIVVAFLWRRLKDITENPYVWIDNDFQKFQDKKKMWVDQNELLKLPNCVDPLPTWPLFLTKLVLTR